MSARGGYPMQAQMQPRGGPGQPGFNPNLQYRNDMPNSQYNPGLRGGQQSAPVTVTVQVDPSAFGMQNTIGSAPGPQNPQNLGQFRGGMPMNPQMRGGMPHRGGVNPNLPGPNPLAQPNPNVGMSPHRGGFGPNGPSSLTNSQPAATPNQIRPNPNLTSSQGSPINPNSNLMNSQPGSNIRPPGNVMGPNSNISNQSTSPASPNSNFMNSPSGNSNFTGSQPGSTSNLLGSQPGVNPHQGSPMNPNSNLMGSQPGPSPARTPPMAANPRGGAMTTSITGSPSAYNPVRGNLLPSMSYNRGAGVPPGSPQSSPLSYSRGGTPGTPPASSPLNRSGPYQNLGYNPALSPNRGGMTNPGMPALNMSSRGITPNGSPLRGGPLPPTFTPAPAPTPALAPAVVPPPPAEPKTGLNEYDNEFNVGSLEDDPQEATYFVDDPPYVDPPYANDYNAPAVPTSLRSAQAMARQPSKPALNAAISAPQQPPQQTQQTQQQLQQQAQPQQTQPEPVPTPTPTPAPAPSPASQPKSGSSSQGGVRQLYKLVIVGGGGVGKSALTIQFIQSMFVEEYDPTIEDSYRKQVTIDNVTTLIDLLDTAGQEEYATMRDTYLRNGEGFLLTYAITTRQSFDDVQQHYQHILRLKDADHWPIVLVANKADLEDQRIIPESEGRALANSWKVPFFETSAFNRQNVDECFFELVRECRRSDLKDETNNTKPHKAASGSMKNRVSIQKYSKDCILL